MNKVFLENIKIAFAAIRSQLLRAVLTMFIIAVGISALVGILTAIDGIKLSINNNFSQMGSNTFNIRNRSENMFIRREGLKGTAHREISLKEAQQFKKRFEFPSTLSISAMASSSAKLKSYLEESDPNITVFGSDEQYIYTSGYEIEKGRNFSSAEIETNTNVILLGYDVAIKLFQNKSPIDQFVTLGNHRYKVIGCLKKKGSSLGMGGDRICIIPVEHVKMYYNRSSLSYVMSVMVEHHPMIEIAMGEAEGVFRQVRKDPLGKESSFKLTNSESLISKLSENIGYVTSAATVIGLITLLGASIGLMNIMLVSVTERTREIGTRMALGASSYYIKQQFLIEAIVICQLGGIMGVLMGMGIGNITSIVMGGPFFVPWKWIFAGVLSCLFVGIVSGYYPAVKASELDPVEALRHE